ncbi:RcnB family protein [soil metagenome]
MKISLKGLATSAMIAATVLSPLAAVEAQAQPGQRTVIHQSVQQEQGPRGHVTVQKTVVRTDHRSWRKGERFDHRQARNYREIGNYRTYRLSTPPRGYHWVRSGNDAVLVAITSGIIGAVIGNAIR